MLPPSAAAEQEALRPVLQWLRAGDTFVWVGIKQQAWAVLANATLTCCTYLDGRLVLTVATLTLAVRLTMDVLTVVAVLTQYSL